VFVPLGYTKGGIEVHELAESEVVDAGERCEAACRCSVKTGRGICGGGAVMFDDGCLRAPGIMGDGRGLPCRGEDCVNGGIGTC
jgi:hypothetical protein